MEGNPSSAAYQFSQPPPESSTMKILGLCCCWIIWIIVVIGQTRSVDSLPIHRSVNLEVCYNKSKELVNEISNTLLQLRKDLRDRFNCTYNDVIVTDITKPEMNTLSACLPQNCNWTNMNRAALNENNCRKAIHSDLEIFRNELHNVNLARPLLNKIEEMMEALKVDNGKRQKRASTNGKFNMCIAILSFHSRAVTISRMFHYLKHGDLTPHE